MFIWSVVLLMGVVVRFSIQNGVTMETEIYFNPWSLV